MDEETASKVTRSGMSLSRKWGKILIHHSVITALHEPKYICFLFNPEKKRLAVKACQKKTAGCFKVPKYEPENWAFKICSTPLLSIIWQVCRWDADKTYRLFGTVHEEHGLVDFELEHATVLSGEYEPDMENHG